MALVRVMHLSAIESVRRLFQSKTLHNKQTQGTETIWLI